MASGSCLCGAIEFTLSGEFSNMTHCHCSMCRKIHGAQFATYFRADSITYNQGQEFIQQHQSSPGFMRSFCNQCGSALPENSTTGEGVYVPAGLMNDDPGIKPEAHIFAESVASDYTITDSLPQHTHYGDGDESRVVEVPEADAKPDHVTGGCQCGAVAFEYTGAPKFTMNCHCQRCRKAKGAAHATNTFVPSSQLTWTRGRDNVQNYDLPDAKVFGQAFCSTCGSSVPRERATDNGGIYNVPVGSLNQPAGADIKGHIFIGSMAPWFDVTDDKPQWDEMPS